ncbi:CAAX prenyl protease-related protein [Aeoliella sp. ICT_H6.2]|uniref:CAAX prenyl protease-related protein n=1 Tax=Aeoliella straminimaris TaxID=2954799 RepID=A0A9X2JFK5_9BACT|nr:CAAX prenyl protease-related protein [Aeoliella straminimaris]MCO6043811.1 CAAX prenyl protease-related protein [Aeoliella straminimaris]
MSDTSNPDNPSSQSGANANKRRALLAFVLPLAIYMLLQSLEPKPLAAPTADAAGGDAEMFELPFEEPSLEDDLLDDPDIEGTDFSVTSRRLGMDIPRKYYPIIYTGKIVVTLAVVLWFLPVYLQWPLKVSPLAIGVGVVGVLLWIGCCWLNLEGHLVDWLGEDHQVISWLGLGPRAEYNPLGALGRNGWGYAFLAVRFFGLALLVPVIEEAFLRAFLMRYVMHDNWTEIPFGEVNRLAVATGILVPVLYHPEKLAALVWFSLVTWLMVRTKNFWDCVAAHAVTNFLLGVVVVLTGWWELW